MAPINKAEWNFNASNGDNTYGGIWEPNATGTDSSIAASPILSPTDIVADGSNVISSATGGLTDALIGNGIYLDNISDWRVIRSTTSTTLTLDATVTTGSGITGNIGGALALVTATMITSSTSGNTFFFNNAASFTFIENIQGVWDGSLNEHTKFEGYGSVKGDHCIGSTLTIFAQGAYKFWEDNYIDMSDIESTSTITAQLDFGLNNKLANVKMSSTYSGAAFTYLVQNEADSHVTGCDFSAPNATGVSGAFGLLDNANNVNVLGCYFHDAPNVTGMDGGTGSRAAFSAFQDLNDAIHVAGVDQMVMQCTFYDNVTAVLANTAGAVDIFNNIFDSNGTAIKAHATLRQQIDGNHYNGNTTDVDSNGEWGLSHTTGASGLVDPANGDMTSTRPAGLGYYTLIKSGVNTPFPQGVHPVSGGGGGTISVAY